MANSDGYAVADTMAKRAVERYYSDRRAGVMAFYLWYRPSTSREHGELMFSPDEHPSGFVLADPQAYRGGDDRNVLFNKVRMLAYRLPILQCADRA